MPLITEPVAHGAAVLINLEGFHARGDITFRECDGFIDRELEVQIITRRDQEF